MKKKYWNYYKLQDNNVSNKDNKSYREIIKTATDKIVKAFQFAKSQVNKINNNVVYHFITVDVSIRVHDWDDVEIIRVHQVAHFLVIIVLCH